MKTKQPKFYWHIHHNVLLEPLTELLKNRIDYIKQNKPKDEIELRLKLLKPVKGKLPDEVIRAGIAYTKAYNVYRKIDNKCQSTIWNDIMIAPNNKVWTTYCKVEITYTRALDAYVLALKAHKKQINKLHKQECPNCPWNGKTIFPNKK